MKQLLIKKIKNKLKYFYYEKFIKNIIFFKQPFIGSFNREKCSNLDELISIHFGNYTSLDHPCKETLSKALRELKGKKATIIETGSSAWGSNSSMLFDLYVYNFGGNFESVDIRIQPSIKLVKQCSKFSRFWCDDSIHWLTNLKNISKNKIDLVYLDSWDLDLQKPIESALHGLGEFLALLPFLSEGSLVLVDDTPCDKYAAEKGNGYEWSERWLESKNKFGFSPGKGTLVKQFIEHNSLGEVLNHDYQILIRLN